MLRKWRLKAYSLNKTDPSVQVQMSSVDNNYKEVCFSKPTREQRVGLGPNFKHGTEFQVAGSRRRAAAWSDYPTLPPLQLPWTTEEGATSNVYACWPIRVAHRQLMLLPPSNTKRAVHSHLFLILHSRAARPYTPFRSNSCQRNSRQYQSSI